MDTPRPLCRALGCWMFVCCLGVSASGAVVGEAKRPLQDRPDDQPRRHVESIRSRAHHYTIEFRGAIDGVMTRMPVGYGAFSQGWQPNRSVRIENVGQSDVHSPRIVVNGRRNWHTLADVVAEATHGCTTSSERARAIWEFRRKHRFHATTWDAECRDALKALCVYGYTLCGDEALVINDLWKAAGLETRRGYPVGHCVTEAFYDGDYHLLDSDEHVICLRRDNRTIASEAEVVRDHDLMKRTHTYGIGSGDSRSTDEFSASLYGYEGARQGDFGRSARHSMDFVLRPGESIEFRWDHVGKQYSAGEQVAPGKAMRDGLGDLLSGWGPQAYANLVNGRLRYRPNLGSAAAGQGAESVENGFFDTTKSEIRRRDAQRPAVITWRFASPYVFVGGTATAAAKIQGDGSVEWRFSADAKNWQTVVSSAKPGVHTLTAALDSRLSPRGRPMYYFWLQLVLRGEATVGDVAFEKDLQMAPLSLPELEAGTNHIHYSDSSAGDRQVRITHQWIERTAWRRPRPTEKALAPADGREVEGSRVAFRWSPALHADGQAIADYHFELSDRADMRWPLSPNFEKLVSLTPSRGKAEWTVPYAGLLNPNTTYFWRVRACDARGVWGPWSRTFSFRIRAPGVPLDVKLVAQDDGFQLQWRANPQGSPPVSYKVYGSNERGFTASDAEYPVTRGKGFVQNMDQYKAKPANAPDAGTVMTPGNLAARLATTSMAVVGPGVTRPNTNKAYYRVVAIDAAGNESGPSDCVEVPRPWLINRPASSAHVGKPYRCRLRVIASDGDLRCRATRESSYNAAFWDREEPRFTAAGLPEGLSIDPQTGLIAGTAVKTGVFPVTIKIENQWKNSREVSFQFTVGP